jgi:hypothetical protein
MEKVIIPLAFLVFALYLCVRFALPRRVRQQLAADLIHDVLLGLWRLVFGPRKVRVVQNKKDGPRGVEKKTRL